MDPADASTLAHARAVSARWRALVDRLPPAELLDLVLAESAYFVEMRGPRLPQARENLKKIRALIRRIQNRGYATLGRIAAHLDRLAVGDESNAVIDALDAVNLMTVHASKGLEFPVVFLVNLARGTGSFRDPIRVVAAAGGEEVSVAAGDFRSDADEDAAAKEREETKRLLYVALTRARDRLYLGSVLKDGRLQPGRGSLAEVLPAALIDAFAGASPEVDWRASSGTIHRFRRCAPANLAPANPEPANLEPPNLEPPNLEPPNHRTLEPPNRTTVARLIGSFDERFLSTAARSDRLAGTLVHRLLQRIGFDAPAPDAVRDLAARLVRPDDVDDCDDLEAVLDAAAASYASICARDEVRALYGAGRRLHEVPFTATVGGRVLRGKVDCLVETAPGRLTLLEFKTGRERPEHRMQLELYVQAVRTVFPGASIDARVLYAGDDCATI